MQSDFGTALSTCSHVDAYRRLADAGMPVYAYQFADRTAPPLVDAPDFDEGAAHASELTFLWPGLLGSLTERQQRLADTMVAYWTAFAHRGTPSVQGAPRWPAYDRAARTLSLDLGEHGVHLKDVSLASNCAWWTNPTVH
ncbi:carboxylesterase family protein [Actinophytocola sediminis]